MIQTLKLTAFMLALSVVLTGCTYPYQANEQKSATTPTNQAATTDNKTSTTTESADVDDELKNLDATMNSVNGSDFDISNLSDSELGL